MSTETQTRQEVPEMGTKPVPEHAWLQKLVGEWHIETEMRMGADQPVLKSQSTQSVKNYGDLWVFADGEAQMPDGKKCPTLPPSATMSPSGSIADAESSKFLRTSGSRSAH